MADSFGDRVAAAVARTGPLCAGIDPSAALLTKWGLSDDADGLRSFCAACVEGFAGAVSVVKPQVAFFERHGSAGLAELERFIAEATLRRPDRHRRRQAGRHRLDRRGLRRRLARRGQPAGRRRGDGAPVSRPGGAVAPGRAGRGQRQGGAGGGPEFQPRGSGIAAGGHRHRAPVEDMLLGEIAELQRLARRPDGDGGCGRRCHVGAIGFRVVPARRGNSGPRAGRPGRRAVTTSRPVLPGAAPAACCRAAPAGSSNEGPDPADLGRSARSLNDELAAALG